MSTRDAARTQRLREEDRTREMAVRRGSASRKAASYPYYLRPFPMLVFGMLVGCLIFWGLVSKGVMLFTPPASPAPAPVTADAQAPAAKRVQPEIDLSFYSQLPAGSPQTQSLPAEVNASGVPQFPEVTAPPVDAALTAATPQGDASLTATEAAVSSQEPVASVPPTPASPQLTAQTAAPLTPPPAVAPETVAVAEVAPAPKPEVAKPEPTKVEPAKTEPAKQTSRYYLQVGTFKSMNAVEQQRAQLAFAGISASVRSGKDSAGAPIYRLVVGPFSSPQAADSTKAKLAANGVSSFITR